MDLLKSLSEPDSARTILIMPDLPKQSVSNAGPWLDVLILLVAASLLVAIRLHAFDLPLETDECNYIYTAGRLLAGDGLYTDVWDHQPPGIFAFFAVVIAVFGDAQPVFRGLATVSSLASLWLLFVICRRLAGRSAGYIAVLLFALISADPGTAGEGCNREIFMNPLALGAVWLLINKAHPTRFGIALAGLLLGAGSLIKTVMAGHWLLLAIWLVWHLARGASPSRRMGAAVIGLLLFAAGPLAVWFVTGTYFAATDRWGLFYEAVFTFNLSYSDTAPAYWQRFVDFFHPTIHRHVFDGTLILWIVAGASVVALPMLRSSRSATQPSILICYLLGSYGAVCLPGQLWPHYYYLMLPPLVAVTATALGYLVSAKPTPMTRIPLRLIGWVITVVLSAGLGLAQLDEYLLVPTLEITDKRYDSRDLWGRAQAANVAAVTDPDDTVFIYGTDAGIYYYSGRRCASRFTMVRALADAYPGHQKRRAQLMEDLTKTRPRLILLVETPFRALDAFLQAGYTPVGADHHDRRTDEVIMEAWMDRSRPIKPIDWEWHRED